MNLDVKRPCGNCPFRRQGAIDLRPGRLAGIVRGMLHDDMIAFPCHKTVYARGNPGTVIEDEDGNEEYVPGPRTSFCAGAMVFLHQAGVPNVAMRLAVSLGLLKPEDLEAFAHEILSVEEVLGPHWNGGNDDEPN